MGGGAVGEVIESQNPQFKPGDLVVGTGGWQEYRLSDGRDRMDVLDGQREFRSQAYLGPVGMPGVTAWYGLNKIIAPKHGETWWSPPPPAPLARWWANWESSPARASVGIAGGADKCAYAQGELGFDAASTTGRRVSQPISPPSPPKGVNGVFENVGAQPFVQCLRLANDFARVRDLRPHRLL